MDEWLSIQEAAKRINRTDRQVRRYVERGRIRSRRRGQYVEYNASDVDDLAKELPQDMRPKVESTQIMPRGEMHMQIERQQQQIAELAARAGYLQAQLDQRPSLTDAQTIRDELTQVRAERDALQHQIGDLQTSGRRAWLLALALLIVLLIVVALALIFR